MGGGGSGCWSRSLESKRLVLYPSPGSRPKEWARAQAGKKSIGLKKLTLTVPLEVGLLEDTAPLAGTFIVHQEVKGSDVDHEWLPGL